MFLDFSCHCWASHAISVNDDLFGKSFSIFLIIAHGIVDEALKDISSFNSDKYLLNFSFAFSLILSLVLLSHSWHLLLVQSSVALG